MFCSFRFDWYVWPNNIKDIVHISFAVIKEIAGDKIPNHTELFSFLFKVKRYYRCVPYHNLEHALTFLHCIYNIILRNKRDLPYSRIEVIEYDSIVSLIYLLSILTLHTVNCASFCKFTT